MQIINIEHVRGDDRANPPDVAVIQYPAFQYSFEQDELFDNITLPPTSPPQQHPPPDQHTQSILQCPVFGCQSLFKTEAGLHLHINGHIADHSKGQVPATYFQGKCFEQWIDQQNAQQAIIERQQHLEQKYPEAIGAWQIPSIEEIINKPAKIIARVPKAARSAFASVAAWTLRDISNNNNIGSWTKWLLLCRLILWDPGRGGIKHTNTTTKIIINRIKLWKEDNIKKLWEEFCTHSEALPKPTNRRKKEPPTGPKPDSTHAKAIKLASLGELAKAFKALTPCQSVCYDPNTINQLQEKHPFEPPPTTILQAIQRDENNRRLTPVPKQDSISVDDVVLYIKRLGRTSSGGVDLFAAQHLIDIAAFEFESRTLTNWAKVVTLIMNGEAGIEMFVHGFKAVLQHIRAIDDAVAIKVDFKNAFNACKRSKLLDLVRRQIPELYGYVKGCYAAHVPLFLPNGSIIQSCTGVHQGDPLGGSLFAIILADALKTAFAGLDNLYHAAYHDDLTLASPSSASIIVALTSLGTLKDTHGIHINYAKTEWISNIATTPPSQFTGITHNTTFDTSLVSVPIGRTHYVSNEMDSKQKEWASQFDKIMALRHSQTMLLILRSSMQLAKVNYFIRSNFSGYNSGWLRKFDDKMRQTMEAITAHPITSQQWKQCQLPVRKGGLGLKTALPYASAAFIASALAASKLLPSIHKTIKDVNWLPTIEIDNAIHDYNMHTPNQENITDLNILPDQAYLSKA
ncbi:hypothetical protein RFI_29106, partial [Reticulomyxa filosa]